MARSHSVRSFCSGILEAAVAHIVWVEVWVVLRVILCYDSILEARLCEGNVPVFDTSLDGLAPFLRESSIYIKYDRLLRLNEFAGEILLHILRFRLQTPAADDGFVLHLILIG